MAITYYYAQAIPGAEFPIISMVFYQKVTFFQRGNRQMEFKKDDKTYIKSKDYNVMVFFNYHHQKVNELKEPSNGSISQKYLL